MRRVVAALALVVAAAPGAAQQPAGDPMARAYDLERRGSFAAAAEGYRAALARRPAEIGALLGLERVLASLGKNAELVQVVPAALAAAPNATPVLSLAMRAWWRAGQPDSARAMAERWSALVPEDEAPWRELGNLAIAERNRVAAKAAFLEARRRLGRPDLLAAELAQLAVAERDFATATREWLLALRALPGYRSAALAGLGAAPEEARPAVLKELGATGTPEAERMAGELLARWGDPVGGLRRFAAALPADGNAAVEALRLFFEQLRGRTGPDVRRAQAMVLEQLAARTTGPQRARYQLDAAQAYGDAGDRAASRRLLGALAADTSAPPTLTSGATSTLILLLVEEGKPDEAAAKLREVGAYAIDPEERAALARRIALGWGLRGDFAKADSALAEDESVDGLAALGRLRLYRGDVASAVALFQAAGPYAGTRAEATARTQLFALLQPLEADSLPALGAALLALDRGDSVAAVQGLAALAGTLPPAKGGAEVRLLAGRVERGRGRHAEAERHFRAAAADGVPATAPWAELELARTLVELGRPKEAETQLEHLILTYPQSALVPQARRELDEIRGAIPRT